MLENTQDNKLCFSTIKDIMRFDSKLRDSRWCLATLPGAELLDESILLKLG